MTETRADISSAGSRPPLMGIRVLAVEQAVAAPLCTQHLADLGAEVIKIERPGSGDFARAYDTAVAGESAWFYWLNRGKRSLALDIKNPRANEILTRLLARSDVFIQNLAPGAMERIGLGVASLREHYPRLVVCSISGYGSEGPYRDRKAYDALLQGETGVIALSGTEEAPAKTGVSVADIATGMYSLSSILAALYRRASDGGGALIETSLLDSLSQWVAPYLYGYLATGRQPKRLGARHSHIVPYGLYPTDGGEVNIAVQNEREWERFCRGVLAEPELETDPRYSSNERRTQQRTTLEPYIEAALKALPHEEVVRRLEAADLPWGEYRDIAALARHPQLLARGRLLPAERKGLPPVLAHPMNIDGLAPRAGCVPAVGEDTDAVLAESGYSPVEVAALRESGAFGAGAVAD
ncbi:MAG TPA: CaiB/BaiF CoA-transferase family protein [Dehalococcoidia bacterium]|nr:CaiB/BaiF CoA-transferase family protein [Dehalococcoidia bacterium]